MIPDEQIRLDQGLKRLQATLRRELLADGGHRSRSPARHLAAMRDLYSLACVIEQSGRAVPVWLQECLGRMAQVLAMLRHGDGGLALFNGAGEGDREAVAETLERLGLGKLKAPQEAADSGFARLQAKHGLLIADAGAPPHGPAGSQAHAGTASFEFSVGRHRMVTNCGGGADRGDVWQIAARGSAAHSVLVLDGRNSAEVLDGGGFGRRPARVGVDRRQDEAGNAWLEITHDGYGPGLGRLYRRRLYLGNDGHDLRGEDSVEPVEGARDAGELPFALRFHLHPDVQASPVQGGNAVLLKLGNQGWRFRASGATVQVEESIYLGRPGETRRSSQIVLNGIAGADVTTVKWAFRKA